MRSIRNFILATALICSLLLLGYSAYNWPYYKLHAPDTRVIKKSAFRYAVEMPILQDVILQVSVACYPRSEAHFWGYRPCDIWIDIYGPVSADLEFPILEFVVEDFSQPEGKYVAEVSVFDPEKLNIKHPTELRPGIIRRKWLKIDLEYEHDHPPRKFKLHIPPLMIDGEPYHVPVVTGIHTRNIEYLLGLVNW